MLYGTSSMDILKLSWILPTNKKHETTTVKWITQHLSWTFKWMFYEIGRNCAEERTLPHTSL